jgi:hypothetical protein
MDNSIKKDIMFVVDYLWNDEEKHYLACENYGEDQIFNYLVRIKNYIVEIKE